MWNLHLWILCLGHLVVDLGQGILPVLTPYLTERFFLSYFQVGIVVLAFNFSSAIIQPVFGVLTDHYPMPWLMPVGLLFSGVGLAMTGLSNSFSTLLLAVLLAGLGVAGYHPEASKTVHLFSEDGKAGVSMSIFSVGGNLGFALGPLLAAAALGIRGLDSVYAIMIPGVLASVVFFLLMPRFKKILALTSTCKVQIDNNVAVADNKTIGLLLLLIYVTIRSFIHSGLIYFIPYYFSGSRGSINPEYLITMFLIAGVIGTILGGTFADRFGERRVLLISMVISLMTINPFLHLEGIWISVLAFIVGASLISTFSTTVVFGQKLLPDNIGLASGMMLGFGVGMGSVGIVLLGALADHLGLPLTMNIISLLPILGIALAFILPDVSVKKLAEAQSSSCQE